MFLSAKIRRFYGFSKKETDFRDNFFKKAVNQNQEKTVFADKSITLPATGFPVVNLFRKMTTILGRVSTISGKVSTTSGKSKKTVNQNQEKTFVRYMLHLLH